MLTVFLGQMLFEDFLTMILDLIIINISFKLGRIILFQKTQLFTNTKNKTFFYYNAHFTYVFLNYKDNIFDCFFFFKLPCPFVLYYFYSFYLLFFHVNNA